MTDLTIRQERERKALEQELREIKVIDEHSAEECISLTDALYQLMTDPEIYFKNIDKEE